MVLRRLAPLVLVAAACATVRPPPRVEAGGEQVTVAMVFDRLDGEGARPVPAMLEQPLLTGLRERGLRPSSAPAELLRRDFSRRTLTPLRLEAMAKGAGPGWLLLVETKAEFASLLTGRFRWLVTARVTLARPDALEQATTIDLEKPVFLDFDFQKEEEALASAADALVRAALRLVDQRVAGETAWRPMAIGPKDVISFVMVDRFRNGDRANDADADPADSEAFHGGDLQGVLDGLDALQSLGVTTVWLSPVFRMRTRPFEGHGAYHGYWTEDLTRVEPRFGDEALLRRLSDELHRRGMKLLLDLVLNHVGYDAPLVAARPDWFHHEGTIVDWSDPHQLTDREVHGLPDLAQEHEEVYAYLREAALGWVERVHPDGFRLDAVKHVPLAFWARFNDDVRRVAGPDFLLLGEALEGDPTALARTLEEGRFGSLFNFPLAFAALDVFCRGAAPGRIGAVLEAEGARVSPLPYVNLLDNHDLPRLAEACGKDPSRMTSALRFLAHAPGIPSVIWGTEHELGGGVEPHNRVDQPWNSLGPLAAVMREAFDAGASIRGERVAFESLSDAELRWGQGARRLVAGPKGFRSAGTEVSLPHEKGIAPLRLRHPGTAAALRVAGTGARLGDWMPGSGPRFHRAGAGLEASIDLPAGGVYEFKLVREDGAGRATWESGPNRYLLHRGQGAVDVAFREP